MDNNLNPNTNTNSNPRSEILLLDASVLEILLFFVGALKILLIYVREFNASNPNPNPRL